MIFGGRFESDAEEKVKKVEEGGYMDQVMAHVLFCFFKHGPELGPSLSQLFRGVNYTVVSLAKRRLNS